MGSAVGERFLQGEGSEQKQPSEYLTRFQGFARFSGQ